MSAPTADRPRLNQPISAGIITALVGYTSSFAVVLTGLAAVGASPIQAASGLFALCETQAIGMILLTRRYRMPLVLVWSTPGAALLAGMHTVNGGWPAAVGAFICVGIAYVITGSWPLMGRLVALIPVPIAQAMLAGVLVELCLAPVTALVDEPAAIIPIVLTWLFFLRFARRWAVPAAFGAAAIVIGVHMMATSTPLPASDLIPRLAFTAPAWSWSAFIGIAFPLYIVTMASQNVPGVAIMKSFGFEVPWSTSITTTGVATLAGATAGAHSVNLAAISAALAAGPEADPDPGRRWIAAHTAGWVYLIFGIGTATIAALATAATVWRDSHRRRTGPPRHSDRGAARCARRQSRARSGDRHIPGRCLGYHGIRGQRRVLGDTGRHHRSWSTDVDPKPTSGLI